MNSQRKQAYLILAMFASAMALLEAAVVVYMRRLYYPESPLDLFPLEFLNVYDPTLELAREIATIVMIVTVALLAERTTRTRAFAAFAFLFGLWDLLYYAWLKVLIGWPRNWIEWDVLFLVPTIWLGPWICPALIALLFVIWGTAVLLSRSNIELSKRGGGVFVLGSVGGLATFLQPAIPIWWVGGMDALTRYQPGTFWWWLFIPSFMIMAAGLASCFWPQAEVSGRSSISS
ncbi:MAG: hypothetical protein OSA98_25410 [Rubripirellula sp.]|nr:hypothetical protein [Rubripirellula sp.]